MSEKEKREAIESLKRDGIYNLSIIGFINETPLEKIIRIGNSMLVKGRGGDKWIYLYGNDNNQFGELIKNIRDDDKYFGALDDWMIPYITENNETDWLVNAFQFHFPAEKEIPENKVETKRLTTSVSEYIISQSMYKDMLSVGYLNERIEKSVSAGIYNDGKLVAWALTHDDGSLGSMHVLEEYRRKGYAREISISLIKQCRELGKIPFLQCEAKNLAAQNLVKSIGYVQDRKVSWLKLK